MHRLWTLPLRNQVLWGGAAALVGLGWCTVWVLPWLTPLSEASRGALLDNWAFLTRAVLASVLVAFWVRAARWIRGPSEHYLLFIVISSIFVLPPLIACALALPTLSNLVGWLPTSLWVLPLLRAQLRPALAGWIFGLLILLASVGEGSPLFWTLWILSPILIDLGLRWLRPAAHRLDT